jgi:hypothetical protein
MATLTKSNGNVQLNFSKLEVLGAFHGSLSAPEEWIESISYSDKPWSAEVMAGVRAPGTGIPLLIMLGTIRRLKSKSMCAVYKRRPVTIVNFKEGPYKTWVVTGEFFK